jgi:nucleotide-binding universal stress UspA family protein
MRVLEDKSIATLDHILVATDFEPESSKALLYARGMAQRFDARIDLLHVIDRSVSTPSEQALVGFPIEGMRKDSSINMERALTDLDISGVHAQGHTVESHLPSATIVSMASSIPTDLIVIGTHYRHGLNKFIHGSCAEGVIHHARHPVLIVGPHVEVRPSHRPVWHKVLLATDLKPDSLALAARTLQFSADSIDALEVCHIDDHDSNIADAFERHVRTESALNKLTSIPSFNSLHPISTVTFGDAAAGILKLAGRMQPDLIVLGAHRDVSWLSHLRSGVIDKIIELADCPVMTICPNGAD